MSQSSYSPSNISLCFPSTMTTPSSRAYTHESTTSTHFDDLSIINASPNYDRKHAKLHLLKQSHAIGSKYSKAHDNGTT